MMIIYVYQLLSALDGITLQLNTLQYHMTKKLGSIKVWQLMVKFYLLIFLFYIDFLLAI